MCVGTAKIKALMNQGTKKKADNIAHKVSEYNSYNLVKLGSNMEQN
jgi:hypothetical protein